MPNTNTAAIRMDWYRWDYPRIPVRLIDSSTHDVSLSTQMQLSQNRFCPLVLLYDHPKRSGQTLELFAARAPRRHATDHRKRTLISTVVAMPLLSDAPNMI